ncbi:MAG: PDR/VanB family oxidoreductase [Cocleimonas sp.]
MSSKNNCRITKIEALTENITNFEIEVLDEGFDKPSFDTLEAGAHIDVYLDDGLIRQYSIWDWSEDKIRVSIAVKREDEGNGGSLKMHQLKVGDLIGTDGPRNHFKLLPNASHYTLIAGGIGVTPIFAMARELVSQNAKVDIYYLVQKEELAAFKPHFERLSLGDQTESSYQLHCDDKDGMFDFDSLVKEIPIDSVIYTCGPEPMLNKVIDTVKTHALHFERFTLSTEDAEKENTSFEVKINSSGKVYTVNEDETILTVLSDNGVDVPSACAAGLCGTCITDVLEGEIDHRDGILSDDEKASNEYMCVCISRAKSAQITLDL